MLSAYQQEISATDDFSKKSMLASAPGGGGYLLAWSSTETSTAQVVVQAVDAEGKAVGSRRTITGSTPLDDGVRPVHVVWDEGRGKFVVGWVELEKGIRLQVVSSAGDPEGSVIEVGKESNVPFSFSLAASNGDIIVPHDDISNGAVFPYVTSTGVVQKVGFGCYCAVASWLDFYPSADGFFSLIFLSSDPTTPGRFFPFQPAKAEDPLSWVTAVYPAETPYGITKSSRLIPGDGSKYLVASPTAEGVTMDTFAKSGAWLEAKPLLTKPVDSLPSVVRAPPVAPGGSDTVLVLGKQKTQYLIGGSSLDGQAITTTKAVVGSAAISGGAMHWGGDAFLVFWMDKPSTYERIYSARLHCQ